MTGNQYLIYDQPLADNVEIQMDFSCSSFDNSVYIAGTYYKGQTSPTSFLSPVIFSSGLIQCFTGGGDYCSFTDFPLVQDTVYSLSIKADTPNAILTSTIMQDDNFSTKTASIGSSTNTLNRFGIGMNGYLALSGGEEFKNRGLKGNIYSFRHISNGTIVRDFIPCYRINDNAVGLYDIISKEFFTNQGDGELIPGYLPYTNLANPYSTEWKNESRLSSSVTGGVIAFSGTTVTNSIDIKPNNIIRLSGADFIENNNGNRIGVYVTTAAGANSFSQATFPNDLVLGGVTVISYEGFENGIYSFKVHNDYIEAGGEIHAIRFSFQTPENANKVIITIDENIAEPVLKDAITSFTINNTSYQMKAGMTWYEWCSSDYNIDKYNNDIIVSTSDYNSYVIDKNYKIVNPQSLIQPYGTYILQKCESFENYQEVAWPCAEKDTQAYLGLGFAYDTGATIYIEQFFDNAPQWLESNEETYIFGAAENNGVYRCMLTSPGNQYGSFIYGGNGSTYLSIYGKCLYEGINRLKIVYKKGDCYFENLNTEEIVRHAANSPAQIEYKMSNNLYLFAHNYNGTVRFNKSNGHSRKIGRFSYYDKNDILICDLYPCYHKTTGEMGMYDKVKNIFLTNIGADNFTKGENIITFTINGINYKAKENTTWYEWCNSEYNINNFYIQNDDIYTSDGEYHVINEDNYETNASDIIINKNSYQLYIAGAPDKE